jgi:hypothetical protein
VETCFGTSSNDVQPVFQRMTMGNLRFIGRGECRLRLIAVDEPSVHQASCAVRTIEASAG